MRIGTSTCVVMPSFGVVGGAGIEEVETSLYIYCIIYSALYIAEILVAILIYYVYERKKGGCSSCMEVIVMGLSIDLMFHLRSGTDGVVTRGS